MENTDIPDSAPPVIDRPGRTRGVGRLLVLGLGLALMAMLLFLFGRDKFGEPAVLAVLGGLAGMGVFFLFAQVLGFIRLTAQHKSDTFASKLVDGMDAGLVVTDDEGRIVYANRAYADLLGAQNETEVTSVETVFSRRMEASEIVYRMANAAKAGNAAIEEFRLSSGLKSGEEGARWFRLRVRAMRHEDYPRPLTVWQISDITSDRKRQESAFQDLQNAIHYLDHAPAGFMASERDGSIVYMNATLADWLGIDLATFESGRIDLSDLVLGDGMALLAAGAARQPRLQDVGHRSRPCQEQRQAAAGPALPSRAGIARRSARRQPHHRRQPDARRGGRRPAARRRSSLHALFQQYAGRDRLARRRWLGAPRQRAVPADVRPRRSRARAAWRL